MIKNNILEGRKAKVFSDFFLLLGVPKSILEQNLGYPLAVLEYDDKQIPVQNQIRMLSAGFAMAEPGSALKLARCTEEGYSGLFYYLIYHSRNLDEAISLLIRYQKLFFSLVVWGGRKTEQRLTLTCSMNYPTHCSRCFIEMSLSSFLTRTRLLTKTDYHPVEVHFRYERPDYVHLYEELFQAPLKFNQEEDAILIDKAHLELKNPGRQPYVKNILTSHADKLLADIEGSEHYTEKVRRIVLEYLPSGSLDIDMICQRLNMSRWTLNRKLNQEGATFKDLCLDIKKKLSIHYLKNQDLSIYEIAYLLGYSEAGAFSRAFKEWMGRSPDHYRRGLDSRQLS